MPWRPFFHSCGLREVFNSSSSLLCDLCGGIFLPLLMNERNLPQRNAEVKKRQDKRELMQDIPSSFLCSLCGVIPLFLYRHDPILGGGTLKMPIGTSDIRRRSSQLRLWSSEPRTRSSELRVRSSELAIRSSKLAIRSSEVGGVLRKYPLVNIRLLGRLRFLEHRVGHVEVAARERARGYRRVEEALRLVGRPALEVEPSQKKRARDRP